MNTYALYGVKPRNRTVILCVFYAASLSDAVKRMHCRILEEADGAHPRFHPHLATSKACAHVATSPQTGAELWKFAQARAWHGLKQEIRGLRSFREVHIGEVPCLP